MSIPVGHLGSFCFDFADVEDSADSFGVDVLNEELNDGGSVQVNQVLALVLETIRGSLAKPQEWSPTQLCFPVSWYQKGTRR